jgi:hypothetical protein
MNRLLSFHNVLGILYDTNSTETPIPATFECNVTCRTKFGIVELEETAVTTTFMKLKQFSIYNLTDP